MVGVGLAQQVDHFTGTRSPRLRPRPGFGTFTYLKRLPINYLKIDIEFVRDLVASSANQHVVEAIVTLAHGFGCQTIAEGVEDGETLKLLENFGVDYAQGYHLGRPAPLQHITVLAETA